ncbi:MAG: two-component system heavy metal sensor histidine kinase CusS [Verrucomicrobiales bacterium]|jgi:two-component system heavy metal sensor histidine kinase CusS
MLSFRIKLALWAALLCGVVLLVFVAASSFIVYDNMLEEADFQLKEKSTKLVTELRANDDKIAILIPELRASLSAEDAELRLLRVLSNGTLLHADPDWILPTEINPKSLEKYATVTHNGRSWRMIARSWDDGHTVLMAIDLSEITEEVMRMTRTYLSALPLALLIIGLGAWWIAGRAVKPVRNITTAAEKVTAGDLTERINERAGGDEIARLTRVFNRMMDKLERSFQQTSRFSADASHELRTPLAVLQGKIEEGLQRPDATSDQQELLADLLEQTQRLKSIIQGLLLFSRSDAGRLSVERERIDLGEFITTMEEDVEFLLEESSIKYSSETPPGIICSGDDKLLRLAVFNLIQNASHYGASDGLISCNLHAEDGIAAIDVANTGAAIPEVERDQIFERFYRSPQFRAIRGQGLGLSLSRVIAEAHGGSLELARSDGKVNVFRLKLPLSDKAAT